MLDALLLLLAIILIVYALRKREQSNKAYFERRNLKYYSPTSLMNIFFNRFTPIDFSGALYNGVPNEPLYGTFNFKIPQYIIRDPELIKQISVKDFDHFQDHRGFTDAKADKFWGNTLFFLKGEKWRQMRATLSPAFTGSKMRQMFELVAECVDEVVNHFLKRIENGEKVSVEMKDFFSRYTNDVIASCAFGLKINSFVDKDNDFFINGKSLMNFTGTKNILKMIFMGRLPAVARALGISLVDKAVGRSFHKTIMDTMKYRKEKNIFRPDMINIMMQVRDGTLKYQSDDGKKEQEGFATVEESEVGKIAVNRKWNDDEIVAQCFLFFAAGFDTSSTLLTFVSYELTVNPDIQQKLYEEIAEMDQQLDGKRIGYDALQKMKYMDQVICETLRKWPPAPQNDRVCVKDYVFNIDDKSKFNMEKGSTCLYTVYGIHHDPKYFPEPENFDPERFNDENKNNIKPGTYIPFGIGPRNCIGSRFALMEIKAILYYMLLHFSFEPNEKTVIPIKLKKSMFVLLPENGLHLDFKMRRNR